MAVRTLPSLRARGLPLASPEVQRETLRRLPLAHEFPQVLETAGLFPLSAHGVEVLQLNLGRLCNQTCRHCHVDAGPDRRESMSRETADLCLAVLGRTRIPTVDLTGGAPELSPVFRHLVASARALGRDVIDRCNLTVLEIPSQHDLAEFLALHRVRVVCSLPHYRKLGTDAQRGDGVFEKSIRALRRLNAVGYGDGRSGLRLTLVTNPVGAFLPANQASLEQEWKREMQRLHGVSFDTLHCLTNMPISRYLEWLIETGNLERYVGELVARFNPAAAANVMCRTTLSVGWDGQLYDCDFNQMLDVVVTPRASAHIRDFDLALLEHRDIALDRHCFGCTAGAGSSCGGATT